MDKLYTINEVAAKLNLSDKTLRRWEEAGRFNPSRTLGNQRRYSLEDLQILDAIKHGAIPNQKDLLTIEQAARFCGVAPATLVRWENAGKIHPFITSGNTYYPRHQLAEKLDELKEVLERDEPEPTPSSITTQTVEPIAPPSLPPTPRLTALPLKDLIPSSSKITPYLLNVGLTLLLILLYHFLVARPEPKPLSPQASPPTGVVQGVSTTTDPRLDVLEKKFLDHLENEMLKNAAPTPLTTINLDNTTLMSGTATLPKGKDQVTIPGKKIIATSLVSATFATDYAPAKKYWITLSPGAFTLHTDFPMATDATFNYLLLESSAASSSAEVR